MNYPCFCNTECNPPPPLPPPIKVIDIISGTDDSNVEVIGEENTMPLPDAAFPQAALPEVTLPEVALPEERVADLRRDSPYCNRLNHGFHLKLGRDRPLRRPPSPPLPGFQMGSPPLFNQPWWFPGELDEDRVSSSSEEVRVRTPSPPAEVDCRRWWFHRER